MRVINTAFVITVIFIVLVSLGVLSGYVFDRSPVLEFKYMPGDLYDSRSCTSMYFLDPYQYQYMSLVYLCRVGNIELMVEHNHIITAYYPLMNTRFGDVVYALGLPDMVRKYPTGTEVRIWENFAQATGEKGFFGKMFYLRLYK